jgi:putative phosphoribosyl transferase
MEMNGRDAIFADRRDAGRRLADRLRAYEAEDPIVLALPRGGAPVAFEVAEALHAPLDVLFVRKIGAPGHPELGLGAVVDGHDPQVVMNPELEGLADPEYVAERVREELAEIERRRKAYLGGRPPLPVRGRTVLLIDDGIATGGSVRAALRGLKKAEARRIILAVPVAPKETLPVLEGEADEVVALATPEPFFAVGLWYGDFTQTTDEEVVDLLGKARRFADERRPSTESETSPHPNGPS